MRLPRALLVLSTLALATTGLVAPSIPPAAAESAPVISAIDTSTPGHAKFTVTTDAPYVWIVLSQAPWYLRLAPAATSPDGTPFDVATWGTTSPTITAVACQTSSVDSCSSSQYSRSAFTPSSVDPTVTWPGDLTVGPGQTLDLNVDDAGGGALRTTWFGTVEQIAHSGVTALHLDQDGAGDLGIYRCYSIYPTSPCAPTGVTEHVEVKRHLNAAVEAYDKFWVSPDGTATPDFTMIVRPSDIEPTYDISWHLIDKNTGLRVPDVGGSVAHFPGGPLRIRVPLDLTGTKDGQYRVRGTISYDSEEFGHLSGFLTGACCSYFRVDGTPPKLVEETRNTWTVYPAKDYYLDQVSFRFRFSENVRATSEVVDADGRVVRTFGYDYGSHYAPAWSGLDEDGNQVPAGTYRLRALATDPAGNELRLARTIQVSSARLVTRHYNERLSATSTLKDRWTGTCSSTAIPSSHGWQGSIGLYSNTKCTGTSWERSGVVSVHALRVPTAYSYEYVSVSVYSGAARSNPRSLAYFEYWDPKEQAWVKAQRLGTAVGWHETRDVHLSPFLTGSRTLYWRVATAGGARYDVKSFHVTFPYRHLEMPS